ncbi:MAG TPA: YHS domain-containing (seleno)protein [Usitatibacter sp.]|nr:YHS domain-containing (seleno)protein [Usitatibacter sp.]
MKPLLAAALAALLPACAPLITQSPGHGLSPVNAVDEGGDRHLMLFGYDVVSFFTDKQPGKGLATIKSVYKDVTFRFASAEHKALFDAAPERYIPQFGGYCSNGIVYAVPWGGDVEQWKIIDGKLYMFGGHGSMDAFMLHPAENMALANKYWNEEVNGSNAFIQRTRRVIFHVPHWKTSKELAEEVARAKKG